MLDPAPARALPRKLLECVGILTPNQTEAAVLIGDPALGMGTFDDAERAALRLLALGVQAVTMKLGAVGSLYSGVEGMVRAGAFQVTAVDTTAAGDVFNGALAVALAEGASIRDAMRFANAAAAVSVTRPGAQNSAPDAEGVKRMFAV